MNTTLKLKSNNSFNPNLNHFNPKFHKLHFDPKLSQNYISTPKFHKLHFDPKLFQNYILTPKFYKSHFGPKFLKNHILTPKPYKHFSQATQAILLKLYKQSWGIFYKPYKRRGINSKLKFIYLYLIVLFLFLNNMLIWL